MARYTIEVLDDIDRYLWESGRRKNLSAVDAQVYAIKMLLRRSEGMLSRWLVAG